MHTSLVDKFKLASQAYIPVKKHSEGLENLTHAVSTLFQAPGDDKAKKLQGREAQFLRDLERFPVEIDGALDRPPKIRDKKEFEAIKEQFVVRDEMTGLHQGLVADLQSFINDNYQFNGKKGIFFPLNDQRKLTLKRNKEVYSLDVEIPIYNFLDINSRNAAVQWMINKNGNPELFDTAIAGKKLPELIKERNLKEIGFVKLTASIDCTNVPPNKPNAMIEFVIEPKNPQFQYSGPARHPLIDVQIAVMPDAKPVAKPAAAMAASPATPMMSATATALVTPAAAPAPVITPIAPAATPEPTLEKIEESLKQMRAARQRATKAMQHRKPKTFLVAGKSKPVATPGSVENTRPKSSGSRPSESAKVSIQFARDIDQLLKTRLIKEDRGFKISLGPSFMGQVSPLEIEMGSELQDKYQALAKAFKTCGFLVTEKSSGGSLKLTVHHKGVCNLQEIEHNYNVFFSKANSPKPAS